VTADGDGRSHRDGLAELARQVERGHLFEHSALGHGFSRIGETETLLHALVDLLLEKGVVAEPELQAAATAIRAQLTERGELSGPGTIVRVDRAEGSTAPTVTVDCAARMHVCHSICCRLDFALTVAEVESGRVKWDLGRPYFIRHEEDGSCTHRAGDGRCGVYADRPGICRGYSCAGDGRIWKDFEKMELNTAWLDEHLGPGRGGARGELMKPAEHVQIRRRGGDGG
jgi:hypothetical protein